MIITITFFQAYFSPSIRKGHNKALALVILLRLEKYRGKKAILGLWQYWFSEHILQGN